jgi:hypothetical protein
VRAFFNALVELLTGGATGISRKDRDLLLRAMPGFGHLLPSEGPTEIAANRTFEPLVEWAGNAYKHSRQYWLATG